MDGWTSTATSLAALNAEIAHYQQTGQAPPSAPAAASTSHTGPGGRGLVTPADKQASTAAIAAAGGAATTFDAEAAASIKSSLHAAGLDELIPLVDQMVRDGLTWPEIEVRLNDPSTDLGKVVDRIYPELREYRDTNPGLSPISVQHVLDYRTSLSQMVSAKGIAEAFPDIKAVARQWIVGNKSLDEMNARLNELEGNVAALAANDPQTQQDMEAWQRFYGVKPTLGNLVALAINPTVTVPALHRQFASVKFDTVAGQQGFGDLSVTEAQRLADSGVNPDQSAQTFGTLARSSELFNPLDSGENAITRDEQLNAGFGLSNAEAARKRIEDRARRRTAAFAGGGSVAATRGGGFGGLSTQQ